MDRNFILALLLSFALVTVWMQWQAARYGEPEGATGPGAELSEQGATETEVPEAATRTPEDRGAAPDRRVAEPRAPVQQEVQEPAAPVDEGVPAELVRVDTGLYSAELTSRGGGIARWELARYHRKQEDGANGPPEPVVLTDSDSGYGDGVALYTPFRELGVGDLREAAYSVTRPDPQTVVFERDRDGFRIRKTYIFQEGSYEVRLRIELENRSERTVAPTLAVGWPLRERNGPDFADHGLVAMEDGSVERTQLGSLGKPGFFSSEAPDVVRFAGQVDWAGVDSRYFLSVLLPEAPRDAMASFIATVPGERGSTEVSFEAFPVAPGQSVVRELRAFLGPKEPERLEAAGAHLERSLDLGWSWIRPLTRFFTWLLKMVYDIVPNYGVVIILITILVKALTAPLTNASMKSMQRMSALQPKMKEIQEKYKEDRQRQSEELMKLYREAGANPVAGCLPMLLQFPFFIALYYALRGSIHLRQAPFFGWINDLSTPETLFMIPGIDLPVRVLPLVMGGTMLASQRLTPTTMDPTQAMMMNTVMPVMFVFLFYQFPSGLVLYWLMNNVLQIAQQLYLNRRKKQQAAA